MQDNIDDVVSSLAREVLNMFSGEENNEERVIPNDAKFVTLNSLWWSIRELNSRGILFEQIFSVEPPKSLWSSDIKAWLLSFARDTTNNSTVMK